MFESKKVHRILIPADRFYPEYAGWINQVMSMLKYGKEFGISFLLYTCLINGEKKLSSTEEYEIKYASITFKKNFITKALYGFYLLFHLIKNRNYIDTVLFPHGYHPFPAVAIACKLLNIPFLMRISGLELNTRNQFALKIRKLALQKANAAIVLNLETKSKLLKMGILGNKIHFVPNGVDTSIFYPPSLEEKTKLKKEFNIPTHQTVFITVGNISKRKGTDNIIQAFAKYRQKNREGILYILGPILDLEYYKEIISQDYYKSTKNYISILGKVDNVASYLKASDIFILASESEGMPNALIEAVATGLKCVCVNIPGVIELSHEINSINILNNYNVSTLAYEMERIQKKDSDSFNEYKKVDIRHNLDRYKFILNIN